jgi:hypothetical protein
VRETERGEEGEREKGRLANLQNLLFVQLEYCERYPERDLMRKREIEGEGEREREQEKGSKREGERGRESKSEREKEEGSKRGRESVCVCVCAHLATLVEKGVPYANGSGGRHAVHKHS